MSYDCPARSLNLSLVVAPLATLELLAFVRF